MKRMLSTVTLLMLLVVCLCVGCSPKTGDPHETDADASKTESTETIKETIEETIKESIEETIKETIEETSNETIDETNKETIAETDEDTTADTVEDTAKEPDSETEPDSEDETLPADDDVVFRFGVMSDTHIGNTAVGSNMNHALTALKSISGDRLDLMLFSGDLTDTTGQNPTSDTEIKKFRSLYNRQLSGTPFLYCLGVTHDLPYQESMQLSPDSLPVRQMYKDVLGNFEYDLSESDYVESGIRHAVVSGYHIFAIDFLPSEEGLTKMVEDMREATAADADRPIFVILHNPDGAYITNLFAEFPQIICFSGHYHNSAAREDSIKQDSGYTQVHIGGTADYRVDGYNRFTDNPFLNLGNRYQFSQSLYVEVREDNTVTITRVDGFGNTAIGESWVVSSERRDVYTNARKASAQPCVFPDGATVSVTENGNSITVSFGAAISGDAGPAMYYRVSLMERDGDEYIAKQVADLSSQHVFYPNDEGIPENHYRYTFKNVNINDYGIVITVIDCWQTSDSVLTYSSGNFVYTPALPPENNGNVALGKIVTVTAGASRVGHSEYDPAMLTDGLFGYYSNHPDRLRGWDKNPGYIVSEDNPIDIVIHLGDTYDIEKVVLHPIVTYIDAFPLYFEYQVSASESGDDWVTVMTNEDVHYNGRLSGSAPLEDYDPDNHYDVVFDEPVSACRFRIHITAPSALIYDGNDCYMGFGEVELYEAESE